MAQATVPASHDVPPRDAELTFAQIVEHSRKMLGRQIAIHSLVNWASRGVRGKKLRTRRWGGRRLTSFVWIDEFFSELE